MSTPATLAASPFVKVFASGLQRGLDSLFHKVVRLRKIDLTLKGEIEKNPAVATAVRDFEIVLGSYRGEFDTHIDAFLRDLETTGIIDSIAQQAILRRRCGNVEVLFNRAFEGRLQSHPKEPSELYNQLCSSFEVSFRELTKDPVLSDLVTQSHATLEARLATLQDCILSLRSDQTLSADSLKENLLRLTRGLVQSYKDVRIETVKSGAKLVNIDKIYIPPQLRYRDINGGRLRTVVDLLIKRQSNNPDRHLAQITERRTRREMRAHISTHNFPEFRNTFRRSIVLGDPGGGKSTLCQKVCYDLTRNFAAGLQASAAVANVPAQSQKIALRVVLRKFEQARLNDPQLDILLFIERDIKNLTTVPQTEIHETLKNILESGQAVLAFDGLDEILDTSKRREFVDLVTSFCDQYPLCPCLVTSRVVGYEDAPLPGDFEEHLLTPLATEQVLAYVKKFLQVVAAKSAPEAEAEAERFIDQTDDNAADLRRNPLLLGLMAFLFHAKGDVPANRPEIYSDCATLMFDKWDKNRGISPDVPSDFERAELFSNIASKMFENVEYRAGVSRDWLQGEVLNFFNNLYLDKARAIKSGKSITDFLVGRAWVMSEVGDGIFAFTHQTFLEYYFARYLDGGFDTVDSLLKELQARIIRSEWDVVTHLALQLKVQGSLRRQEEALAKLTGLIGHFRTAKYDLAARLFSAKSLEYLNGTEDSVRNLVGRLADIEKEDADFFRKIDHLTLAVRSANQRRQLVTEIVTDSLVKLLLDGDKLNFKSRLSP